ncbi:MAG: hypothetical protein HY727_14650 [Candidatus Rokubacteria bacterium]|nr:hypothetical protein [Candidatus Rokubacteria bacterium]
MAHPETLDRLVQQVSAQIRWRRAEHYGLRGAFYSTLAGVLPLFVKASLAAWALPLAIGLAAAGTLGGALYGFFKPVAGADAARLADQAFGLEERVSTALEWAERPDRSPLVDALLADAVERTRALELRQIVRRVLPREARLLPVPVVAGLILALAPPIPVPSGLPHVWEAGEQGETKERSSAALLEERSRPFAKDPLKRTALEERDLVQRSASGGAATAGDLSAIFKDTALTNQRPDFNSFLRKGDERLKLLEQVDRLPDLQSDFTASQYKMVFRKSKALAGGLRPDQISPQKLRELLDEMERLGRKGGTWGSDVSEGMEALEYGQQDRALEAMEKALNKMRALEERQRGSRALRGGRESERGTRGRPGEGTGPEDMDFGEGEGLMPGKGKSLAPKGEASSRLRISPYDAAVEGEARRGRKEGYDTNMTGRGASMASRLQYLGVIGQYRKMMEDAIAREQVPRDYHEQIKEYFQALDER